MAALLAGAGMDAVFSYAGRTARPADQPLPVRIGGFGGAEGLAGYLRAERITHLVDATHPFAATISRNAIAAAEATMTPLVALERPGWQAASGDRWTRLRDLGEAARALPERPARVFLAIGRQNLSVFAGLPHHWLLRLVDPPDGPLPLAGAEIVIARGPFTADADEALLRAHRISHVIAKNAGGAGAEAKLIAARRLGLGVLLVDRPALPPRRVVAEPAEVIGWLHRTAPALRGV